MAIPQLVRRKAENALNEFVRRLTAEERLSDGELRWQGNGENLVLLVAKDGEELPLARFSFIEELRQWTLHYRDKDGRWAFYLNAGPTLEFGRLLAAVESDPFNFFWPR